MHAFAVVLTDHSYRNSIRGIMFIANMRRLRHLNVKAGRIILWMKDVLPSGVLLLEDMNGRENCAPCHLSIEGTIHLEKIIVLKDLPFF